MQQLSSDACEDFGRPSQRFNQIILIENLYLSTILVYNAMYYLI